MIAKLKNIFTATTIMLGRALTLSGKKKIIAVVGAFIVALASPLGFVAMTAPQYLGLVAFLSVTVTAYLKAETELDKKRAAAQFLNAFLYNLSQWKTPAGESSALMRSVGDDEIITERGDGFTVSTGTPQPVNQNTVLHQLIGAAGIMLR